MSTCTDITLADLLTRRLGMLHASDTARYGYQYMIPNRWVSLTASPESLDHQGSHPTPAAGTDVQPTTTVT